LISCTESETYAHVGLREGGPVFCAPLCILHIAATCFVYFKFKGEIYFIF